MKKIMFNDKYGLTEAVLDREKKQTRRICKNQINPTIEESRYKISEIIAVAQPYKELESEINNKYWQEQALITFGGSAGWSNKMFVKAEFMPHQIKITNIRIERLQDISREDCIREGIMMDIMSGTYRTAKMFFPKCHTLREAYKHLIDAISGRGTWESNPWVYAYDFELVK